MPNPSRPKRLLAQLRDVRDFYAKGQRSQAVSPDRLGYGEANSSARRRNLHPEMLRKARQIAQEFPAEKFERLLTRCEARDFAIGITHLMRLASVNKGRSALITRMIDGRWSLRQLNNEIAKVQPSMAGRGRRRLVPEDAAGQLVMLKKECVRWKHLNQALAPNLKSPRVRQALRRASRSIDSLLVAVDQVEV
jgi:hypothetical protein